MINKSQDLKISILCISDVHYNIKYKSKSILLKNYLKSFISFCKTEFTDIDYILLTGDITQEGTEDDFSLFFEDILDPLFALPNFKNCMLLSVPGNHDLQRKDATFLHEFIKNLSKNSKRKTFLSTRTVEFESIFKDYSEAFKKFKLKIPKNISRYYKDNFFNGYFVDHKKKSIVVLLNSSWFSLGNDIISKFLTHHFEIIDGKIISKNNKNDLFDFLVEKGILKKETKLKDFSDEAFVKYFTDSLYIISNEYGSQVLNLECFPDLDSLKSDMKNYNDYILVTVMHHDFNWLIKEERMSFKNENDDPLSFLKNNTDLLLTGHMHVPFNYHNDYLNENKILNIPLGSFMKHSKVDDFKYDDNWFSVLQINIKKRNVVQSKYSFDIDKKSWFKNNSNINYKLNKKYYSKLTPTRKTTLEDKIRKSILDKSFLPKYFNCELFEINNYYYCKENNEIITIVDKSLNEINNDELKKHINNYCNVENIHFVFIDLTFENKEYSSEFDKDNDRMNALGVIKDNIEFKFDEFRHKFFSSIENKDVPNYSNLSFICTIIPYWELESFLN